MEGVRVEWAGKKGRTGVKMGKGRGDQIGQLEGELGGW